MPSLGDAEVLTVGIAQISPVWLNRNKTLEKIIEHVTTAANQDCQLVVFGEALLPGYPFWIELTDGARFNSPLQKEIHTSRRTACPRPTYKFSTSPRRPQWISRS